MQPPRRYLILDTSPAGGVARARDRRLGSHVVEPRLSGRLRADLLDQADAAQIAREPNRLVAEVLPTKLIHPVATAIVHAPTSSGTTWGIEAIRADISPLSGRGVKVAVLDTGIDETHEAFAHLQIEQMDFLGGDGRDDVGHGTHCAGTIAGGEINGCRLGVAPGIDTLFVGKVLAARGGTSEALADGIIWARESGAELVSMSLGIDFPGHVATLVAAGIPVAAATSQALVEFGHHLSLFRTLAEFASNPVLTGAGSLLVAATGNESARSASPPYTIASSPPAAADGFVAVGAVRQEAGGSLSVADFSNTGPDIAAPGVDVLSAYPGDRFAQLSGTSMAAPHVTGVAALWAQGLKEAGGAPNPEILRARLVGHARHLAGADQIDVGVGLAQAPEPPS